MRKLNTALIAVSLVLLMATYAFGSTNVPLTNSVVMANSVPTSPPATSQVNETMAINTSNAAAMAAQQTVFTKVQNSAMNSMALKKPAPEAMQNVILPQQRTGNNIHANTA